MSSRSIKKPAARKTKPNETVYLSLGHFNGRPTWHYLIVGKLKLPILMKATEQGEVDLCEFGQIIFSGFGEVPPAEIKQYVQNVYGDA